MIRLSKALLALKHEYICWLQTMLSLDIYYFLSISIDFFWEWEYVPVSKSSSSQVKLDALKSP